MGVPWMAATKKVLCPEGGSWLRNFPPLVIACGTCKCKPHCPPEPGNVEVTPGWQLQKSGLPDDSSSSFLRDACYQK